LELRANDVRAVWSKVDVDEITVSTVPAIIRI